MKLRLLKIVLLLAISFALNACSGTTSDQPEIHVPAIAATEQATSAMASMRAGDLTAAQSQISEAIAIDPDFGGAYLYQGFILSRAGNNDAATESFAKAVELAPYNCEAPIFLGLALEKRGEKEAARNHYKTSAACFAEMASHSTAKPQQRVYEAVARYLHRGKLEGVQAISEVLTDWPDFVPAQRMRERFLADDRSYFYRWASAPEF